MDPLDRMVLLVHQALWDPQEFQDHLGLKEIVEKMDLKAVMEPRVTLVLPGYRVKMVCLVSVEIQDHGVQLDPLVPKEMLATRVYLALLVH